MTKKLLLFGGAFNPPHEGHIRLLTNAIEYLKPDITLVLPTAVSPHKTSGDISFSHRYNMAKVFKQLDSIRLSSFENRGNKKKNYTIQTIKWIEKKYIGYDIYLLIGSDMLTSFTTWSRYRRIISKANILVASRENDDTLFEQAIARLKKEGAKIEVMYYEPIVISSSEIRSLIKEGKQIESYLPSYVAQYIKKNNLYQ